VDGSRAVEEVEAVEVESGRASRSLHTRFSRRSR